jgi:hypothetical protein
MFAFHPANGGYRSKVGAAILKHMGAPQSSHLGGSFGLAVVIAQTVFFCSTRARAGSL